jgi:plastocyanin domain-containing protein
MDKILVSLLGLGLIGGIYWFFFGKKEELSDSATNWNITVEGGYTPATITVPVDKKSTITFTRRDSNSCLEEIVIPDFKVKKFLPLNAPISIVLSPAKKGIFTMHCGMNMFHGKIIVI